MKDLLWTLAFDHRNSLRRFFFGIRGEATDAEHERARDAKAIIFEGIVKPIERGIPSGQPAVLVDEEYGAEVIARAREMGIATAVPVEASGNAVLQFEHGDDGFGEALERIDPTYAEVLVRYNPDGDPDEKRVQADRLGRLQRWVSHHGRQWMLELLVPPTPAQTNQCGGDAEVYDSNLRPELTVRAAAELVAGRSTGRPATRSASVRRVSRIGLRSQRGSGCRHLTHRKKMRKDGTNLANSCRVSAQWTRQPDSVGPGGRGT